MVRIATSRLSGHPGARIASPARPHAGLRRMSGINQRPDYPGGSFTEARNTIFACSAPIKTPALGWPSAGVSSAYASRTGSHGCLGAGGLDPVRRRGRLVVRRARLWPAERRRYVADRYGDDPVRIPAGELVLWKVLAEPGDCVLIGLVVGPHVEIARRGIHA